MTVNELEETYRVSVILLCKNGERLFHPAGKELIEQGQTIAIFGDPEQINLLLHERSPVTVPAIKIGIVGPCTAGKSTLIKRLDGQYQR